MQESFRMTKLATVVAIVLAASLSGCGPVSPGAPYGLAPDLPIRLRRHDLYLAPPPPRRRATPCSESSASAASAKARSRARTLLAKSLRGSLGVDEDPGEGGLLAADLLVTAAKTANLAIWAGSRGGNPGRKPHDFSWLSENWRRRRNSE